MHLDENQEDKLVLSRMLQEGLYTTAHSRLLSTCNVLRHSRDVHPTWVKSFTKTLGNGFLRFCSTRAKSKEDFDSY